MNLSDVTIRLLEKMPYINDEFTEYMTAVVASNSISGRVINVVTSTAHGLVTGDKVLTDCSKVKNTIKEIAIDSDNAIVEMNYEHDYIYESGQTVEIEFVDNNVVAWNGTFTLLDVTDKTHITIAKQSDTVPTVYGYIWEDRSKNGSGSAYTAITKVSDTEFSFELDDDTPSLPETELNSIKIIRGCRIAGVADPERAVQIYTDRLVAGEKSWLFIMLGDEIASKDLKTKSDATATFGSGDDSKLKLIKTIDIIAIFPTTTTGAYTEVEKAMGEIRQALLDCLHGYTFTNVDAERVYKTIYTGSKPYIYNTATYIRSYSFEVTEDITSRQEVASKSETVALRNTMLSLSIGNGDDMTVTIEHGEEDA